VLTGARPCWRLHGWNLASRGQEERGKCNASGEGINKDGEAMMWWCGGIEGRQHWEFGAPVLRGSTHHCDCMGMERKQMGPFRW
jgi:hypothetical protein